ncbi:MAG: GNAT family N-acetyltransferase [Paludibacteraceae bacterium]|nr:GNAT family N-acetyltransferase [Paludibacteraceae bacterium]MBO5975261.1 GNAT family N-acetyltransferase [Paludibacteraceae bacterium]MBO7316508.1 GNAT family N-acetyltransferase [Paludibacteraceae bacterium]
MEAIKEPVDKELIKRELTADKFLRHTNKAGNEIYVVTAHDSPNIMTEIGRLRELSFRTAGGGTGKSIDVDEYDFMENPYKQLFVWDPKEEQIIGGYRFINGKDVQIENGQPKLATSEVYNFSEEFIDNYLTDTIELARSFVQPDYQSSKMGSKSLFALDNLWDGLGAIMVKEGNKYFFGKVTIYPQFDAVARDLILGFIRKHFEDKEKLVSPKDPFQIQFSREEILKKFTQEDFKEDYKLLNTEVRALGVNIPPLVNAYMGLSDENKYFGGAVFPEFGNVIEFGLLVPTDKIHEEKKKRHIESFFKETEKNI